MIHPDAELLIQALQRDMPQSLLLTGQKGVGLYDIARRIADATVVNLVRPDESTTSRVISVERIRRLYDETKSRSAVRQFFIIDEADAMTHAAQTAFLKLLEEPAESIYFILTSSAQDRLLPTILSRVQRRNVKSITTEQSAEYIASHGVTDKTKVRQLLFIADGLPEELDRLIQDDVYFEKAAQRMKDARELLQASPYDRLVLAQKYKDNRQEALELIHACISITRMSLSVRPQAALITQLKQLLDVQEALLMNQNIRLQLARLVI
ncbi:MAG: AAA family ATPase [Candidatus Saccharibacteria bacterium]